MYTIKAHVMTDVEENGRVRTRRVATAVIKTDDNAAFSVLSRQPLAGIPDHCHVNVDTYVNVRGYQFPADTGFIDGMIRGLCATRDELRGARSTVKNGAVHNFTREEHDEA